MSVNIVFWGLSFFSVQVNEGTHKAYQYIVICVRLLIALMIKICIKLMFSFTLNVYVKSCFLLFCARAEIQTLTTSLNLETPKLGRNKLMQELCAL